MKIHGFYHSEQEMTVMIDTQDKNRNGKIDFEEFVSMMLNITESSVDQGYNVSEAFQVFDKVKLLMICLTFSCCFLQTFRPDVLSVPNINTSL